MEDLTKLLQKIFEDITSDDFRKKHSKITKEDIKKMTAANKNLEDIKRDLEIIKMLEGYKEHVEDTIDMNKRHKSQVVKLSEDIKYLLDTIFRLLESSEIPKATGMIVLEDLQRNLKCIDIKVVN